MKSRPVYMQIIILILLIFYLHIKQIYSQSQSEIVAKFEKRSHTYKTTTLPYRIFIPEEYNSSTLFPLVLGLHGAGEVGTDNEIHIQANRMATSWADTVNQNQWPCFVVAPQCPTNNRWVDWTWTQGMTFNTDQVPISNELETVNDLLDFLIREFSIDTDRIYITGLSMGGYGVWDMIARFPSRFAAAVPMSGCGDTSKVDEFKIVSIWDFHGALDSSVPVRCSRIIFSTMEQHNINVFRTIGLSDDLIAKGLNEGAKHIYTEYPEGTHGIWDQSYDYPLLFPWVFAQTRQSSPVIADETNPHILRQYQLGQNYPNPFNPETVIPYTLFKPASVRLTVFDILGRKTETLVNDFQTEGNYQIIFNGQNRPSGIYTCRLEIDGMFQQKSMTLIR